MTRRLLEFSCGYISFLWVYKWLVRVVVVRNGGQYPPGYSLGWSSGTDSSQTGELEQTVYDAQDAREGSDGYKQISNRIWNIK